MGHLIQLARPGSRMVHEFVPIRPGPLTCSKVQPLGNPLHRQRCFLAQTRGQGQLEWVALLADHQVVVGLSFT